MKRIKDLQDIDRPREKLIAKGAQSLSSFELLEIIIGSGNKDNTVEQLAARVQKLMRNDFNELTHDKLTAIKGLGNARSTQILAAIELAKRYVLNNDQPLNNQQDFVNVLGDIKNKKQEYLVCLTLDGARRLISRRVITVGLLDSVLAHPREIFTNAISDRAAGIVIGHNHPSGDCKPSKFDKDFNQKLIVASQVIGIELIDHIILSNRGYYSFKNNGEL